MNLLDMAARLARLEKWRQNIRIVGGKGVRVTGQNSPEGYAATVEALASTGAIGSSSSPLTPFLITAAVQDGTNKRWVYGARKAIKNAVGYGGWVNDPNDGDTYTLYHSSENMNGASGLYGNGTNSANLTGSFDIQPVPTGPNPVWARPVTFTVDGTTYTEWWFDSPTNGVDGAC